MLKNILVVIFVCLIVLSCQNKKTDVEIPEQIESFANEINDESVSEVIYESFSEEIIFNEVIYEPVSEEIINLLNSQENYTELLFIHKVNFGIPNGDNYIVLWKIKTELGDMQEIFLYSISNKIESRFHIPTGLRRNDFNNNIMRNMPGIHIENVGASVFDYNGDGIDELFSYDFGGNGTFIGINGYDAEKDKIINYCNFIGFENIKNDTGSPPVVFTKYKNQVGFKVYSIYHSGYGPPGNLINDYYVWYFYSWDREANEYRIVGEYLVNEAGREIESKFDIYEYPLEYFSKRIQVERLDNVLVMRHLEEIDPKIEGGRSFKVTIMTASDKALLEWMVNFDSEGKIW